MKLTDRFRAWLASDEYEDATEGALMFTVTITFGGLLLIALYQMVEAGVL